MFERLKTYLTTDKTNIVKLHDAEIKDFLLEQILNSNLQRKGKTLLNAPDIRFTSNEEFWNLVLKTPNVAMRWVELTRFQIVDWFPRTPGLYHTSQAIDSRRSAEYYMREENGIRLFYDRKGKQHMMNGGLGSVRFKPIIIDNEEHWLCTATSDSYCHSGIPLAIPDYLMQKIDCPRLFKISGQIKFIPTFLEEHFHHVTRIPQIYILVDNIKQLAKTTRVNLSSVKITPMVFFTGKNIIRHEEWRELFHPDKDEGAGVTYVTCYADSIDELNRSAEWLEEYVDKRHGRIITNFDQQRPTFQDAPFSLQNIMSGKLNTYNLERFHIDHAEIICKTVENIHSEAITMTQIEVKLENGVTIHGDFVVANSINDSFKKATTSNLPDEFKELLKQLTTEIGKMTEKMPKETAQQVVRDLDNLIEETTSLSPRKQWWQLSIEGLKQAAKDVGDIGKPVFELAEQIMPLLTTIL